MGAVLTAYNTAISALEALGTAARAAQPSADTALKSAVLAKADTESKNAIARLKGSMADERTKNLLTTLDL